MTFNGIHKSHENCDSYTIKQNEVLTDKSVYLGFALLELSMLHMYETNYDKPQTYFGQKRSHLLYVDKDAFVLSVNTKDIMINLKNLEDMF